MEDVWNRINLTSLNNHHHSTTHPATGPFYGMLFQDLLPPISGNNNNNNNNNKDPPKTVVAPLKYGFSVPTNEISLSTPGSPLSLTPCPDFENPVSNDLVIQNPQVCLTKPSYFSHDYHVMPAHHSLADHYTPFSKKRESGQNADQRRKRMMKNRESAARSRSRRQAYTTELELEMKKLAEENAMLKKKHEKLLMTVASNDVRLNRYQQQVQEVPKKHGLQRTSTCPF